jgi:transcriptional regulator with XRE-family HTH domain
MLVLKNLRHLRERAALSQRDLAALSGVAPASIIRAEKGEPIRFVTARKLATALGVDPAELMGIDEEQGNAAA